MQTERKRVKRIIWTDDMTNLLKENYATKSAVELGHILGVSEDSVRVKLKKMGLKKPPAQLAILMNTEELAYLAGIIDGEGCINIRKNGPNRKNGMKSRVYFAALTISNVDPRIMIWIRDRVGSGYILPRKGKGNRRDSYSIIFMSRYTFAIIEAVYKYLVIKAEQANLLFEFRDTFGAAFGKKRMPKSLENKREELFLKMKQFHHQEFPPLQNFTNKS